MLHAFITVILTCNKKEILETEDMTHTNFSKALKA